ILVSILIAGAGMLGSVATRGFGELLALRALTGVGIGGTIASVAVLVSEYAPDRWRSAALAAYSTGYPVGATLGGALTALAIPRFGWRSAFAIGGVMTLALLVVAWRVLPESLDFLLARRPPGALGRLNELLVRMRLPKLGVLPGSPASSGAPPPERRAPLRSLPAPHRLAHRFRTAHCGLRRRCAATRARALDGIAPRGAFERRHGGPLCRRTPAVPHRGARDRHGLCDRHRASGGHPRAARKRCV